jgi:Flp pilus assembly protein TadD
MTQWQGPNQFPYVPRCELGQVLTASETAIRLNDRRAFYWIRLATIQDRLGNHNEAIQSAQKAVEISPGGPWTHVTLGISYDRIVRTKESIA